MAAAAIMTVLFLVVYLPDLGHGFLKDDFRWIWTARSNDWRDLLDLFQQNVGFYRPVVSVSFAADHAMWGLNPYGYGLTNLLLCLVDALLIFAVARRLELPSGAAMIAAFVWLFNFHGVSMALLWLSGRTALLLILFALATAHAMFRGRTVAAGVLSLFAMLSKEEAVVIPLMWTAIAWIETTTTAPRPDTLTRVKRAAAHTWPLWMALALYGALRLNSGAFGALDAPSYYQFSLSPVLVARNILRYADRAGTVSLAVIILFRLVAGRLGDFSASERRTLDISVLWILTGYALTVFLPIPSSLYALFPSVGTSLAAAACASRVLRLKPQRFARAAAIAMVSVSLLIPVYRSRNQRWVGDAELSARTLNTIQSATRTLPQGGRIVLIDDPRERYRFASAFDSALPEALALTVGEHWTGEVVGSGQSPLSTAAITVRLARGGQLLLSTE